MGDYYHIDGLGVVCEGNGSLDDGTAVHAFLTRGAKNGQLYREPWYCGDIHVSVISFDAFHEATKIANKQNTCKSKNNDIYCNRREI